MLAGTIYDTKKEIVERIFNRGNNLNKEEINHPFTIIVDESDSYYKNRDLQDKISISVIESGFLFLVSPEAQKVLKDSALDNLQFFDVSIKASDLELNDYKIVNITDKIDCADFDKSDLDFSILDDEDIDEINELVLDETKIPKGKKIFLLGKSSTGIILIHDDLKKAIEDAGLTGFHFVKLEEAYTIY